MNIAPMALAAILAAYTAPAKAWEKSTHEDDFSGKTRIAQTTRSTNSLQLSFPYEGRNYGHVHVVESSSGFKIVMLTIDKGQFFCQVDYCAVAVKFGDKEPRNFVVHQSDDRDGTTLFFSYTEGILEELKQHRNFKVRASLFQSGLQTLNFTNTAPIQLAVP